MNRRDLHVAFNAPLNEQDTESQTYGCRANNPDICSSNSIPNVCAFESIDGICRKPSRAWKRKYSELKKGGDNS